jgi:hypothetical protein
MTPFSAEPPRGALDRTGWTADADSETDADGEANLATHAIDGDLDTYWHSDFKHKPNSPLPHRLDLFFGGAQHMVSGIVEMPRQFNGGGRIGKFEIYVSKDGINFTSTPVAAGEWPDARRTQVWFVYCRNYLSAILDLCFRT